VIVTSPVTSTIAPEQRALIVAQLGAALAAAWRRDQEAKASTPTANGTEAA
jgi:hypothetical protein